MTIKFAAVLSLLVAFAATPGCAQAGVPELRAIVAKRAAIVRNMHDKATRAIVQVAQDPAFPGYFTALHEADAGHAHDAKVRIDQISLATQEKFRVEEMCLIDASGAEVSRIVQNQVAYDLSTAEESNAFFAPSFATAPRATYIAPLYISADVQKWVLAYTTPIAFEGHNAAILHYEHGLDVYQAALNKEPAGADTYILAVDSHGFIVSDSRADIAVLQLGDEADPASYFAAFSLAGLSLEELRARLGSEQGMIEAGGARYAVALQAVADWTIVGVQLQH